MKKFQRSLSLLLAVIMLLGMVYIGPAAKTEAAAASDYISASYPSSLSVMTTKTVGLMQYPISTSAAKYTLGAENMLTVKALHKNTAGAYFYEVLFYNMTLYVDATACAMVDHLTGDVKATDLMTPGALGSGAGFPVTGKITSSLNKLGTITASVHKSSNIHVAPVIESSDTANGYAYTLDNSKVDVNLIFSDLANGSYTFLLTAEAISYYIDGSALTTSTKTVVLENKPLIVSANSSSNAIVAKGIDVSVHNGSIDWSKVATQVDFAILRIGWEYTLDTRFVQNAAGCNQYGVPFGVYIYSYAESEAEAIKEAQFVIEALKPYDVDLPIFFDIEDECQSALGATAIQNIVKAFCDTIRDAGYEPGLYTFLSWFNSYFGGSYYNSLPKWVAQIDTNTCTYAKGLTMWQYSWTGSFSGISGNVDCNYYYGEFPGKNTDTSYLSKCTYYPSNLDATLNMDVNLRQYPSTDYSILTQISAGTQLHITGLYKNTYGNYWYQVEYNGATGYIGQEALDIDSYRYDDLSVVGPTMENLALNAGYYMKGKMYSVYNNMYKVHARIYSGEDTQASPVLSSSATPNAKKYVLNYSDVCDNMIFSDLDTGYYTYEISADVKNYYVDNGTLKVKDENVVLWTKPFTVGGASITPPAETACSHSIVTQSAVPPTCTAEGKTEGSYCSKCGLVFATQETIPATGHSYTATSEGATCQDYELFHCVCTSCGHSYDISADQMSQWSEQKPVGVDESKIESITQYRYADCTSKAWQKSGSGSVVYVNSWAAGFDTSSSVYTQYNKKSSKVTASETATTKTVVDSDSRIGYLWYHWCSPSVTSSWATKYDTYTTFHTYYGTTAPSNYSCDTSDYSYKTAHSSCSNTSWWFPMDVYEQKYTTYEMAPDGKTWGPWSDWSETVYTAVENSRKVESRTVYRYIGAELAPHNWVNGVCGSCGTPCDHDFGADGLCTICGESDVCRHVSHDQNGICTKCGEAVEHSYENRVCTVCGKTLPLPSMSLTGVSASFENEILMNIYFTVSNLDNPDAANMGLITWDSPQSVGTLDTAQSVISEVQIINGQFRVSTNGIAAKKLGDNIYCKLYVKMEDGSVVYSPLFPTSPKSYATTLLKSSGDSRTRALCVSVLNYGAAAQTYFSYKPYDLMNAALTSDQQALVMSYDPSMLTEVTKADPTKCSGFAYNKGFATMGHAVDFDSAFAVNTYLTPSYAPENGLTIYYWTEDSYNSLSRLTKTNADRVFTMQQSGEKYMAAYEGIAAKEVDDIFYFAVSYENEGITYTSGVYGYSVGAYCAALAAGNTAAKDLAAKTAVYSYYARLYFNYN